jgi:hypothetical protein
VTQPIAPPDVVEVRRWCQASTTAISDEDLAMVVAAEVQAQTDDCRVDPYTASLHSAVLRRCARHLSARGVPLGIIAGEAEHGAAKLPSFDGEIERLEGTRRKFNFG